MRTIFLYLRLVENYCPYTRSAIFHLAFTVRSNSIIMVIDTLAEFCLRYDIQNISSNQKVIM